LVRPEYSGPALKVVPFDRSGHFGRSDRNVPFHLTKLLFPVPLFCILLARTITKRAVAWVGSVQPECTVPLDTWNFRNFKPGFSLNGKRPMSTLYGIAFRMYMKAIRYSMDSNGTELGTSRSHTSSVVPECGPREGLVNYFLTSK